MSSKRIPNYSLDSELRDDAKPFCLYTPRRVPLPLMKKVEDEINGLVKSGVIESVDEPTDWCAPMVAVLKPNRNVRLCVDLTKLKKESAVSST